MADHPQHSEASSRANSEHSVHGNINNNEGPVNPPVNNEEAAVLTPVQIAMLQQMTNGLLAGVLQNMPGGGARMPVERIKKTTADDFTEDSTDPSKVEDWLQQTRWCMDQLGLNDVEKVAAVQGLLKGQARNWWETVLRERQGQQITWATFQEVFERKYVIER